MVIFLLFFPGTVTVKLEWKEPQSDLPILRYKVFWSRRARGIGGELDSVLVNHQNVAKVGILLSKVGHLINNAIKPPYHHQP